MNGGLFTDLPPQGQYPPSATHPPEAVRVADHHKDPEPEPREWPFDEEDEERDRERRSDEPLDLDDGLEGCCSCHDALICPVDVAEYLSAHEDEYEDEGRE